MHTLHILQVVTGFAGSGQALVANPNIDKVIFTGSPGVGRKVMEGASYNLKPVVLELGGKDPMILTETTSMDDAISWTMRGAYQNAGQNCCGVERVFVYEGIYDEFVDKITKEVKQLRQGNPHSVETRSSIDCGSMCMPNAAKRIQELVDEAVSKGAIIQCGGDIEENNKKLASGECSTKTEGFYPPTVMTNLEPSMRICQEEVFGPIMCVVKVPGNSDEKCIELVNSCDFALGASVYCTDIARADKIAKQVKSGMVTINDFGCNYLIQTLPFGGVGESGFDRFAGVEGLRGCCYPRAVVHDTFPMLMKTTIPPALRYPVNYERAFGFGQSLVQLFYDESWWGKIKGGIFGLIRHG